MEEKSKVYIKLDANNNIIRIDGGYSTPKNLDNWIEIDEGYGDKYNLCQSNYLSKSLITENGSFRYKFENGKIVEKENSELDKENLPTKKLYLINQSKSILESYLQSHPVQWTDGKFYSITREKQQQLTSKLFAASSAKQTGAEYDLKWNSTGDECVEWTLEELFKLAFYIDSRVTALVSYQQTLEKQINACQTTEEIETIVIDYDSVK